MRGHFIFWDKYTFTQTLPWNLESSERKMLKVDVLEKWLESVPKVSATKE